MPSSYRHGERAVAERVGAQNEQRGEKMCSESVTKGGRIQRRVSPKRDRSLWDSEKQGSQRVEEHCGAAEHAVSTEKSDVINF
mmetsp:Transcript_7777/g.22137  ORF Transcript_7777/g.22137 Transcript_7777/m.22137 type:complete len:83 (+) Transcript_7777:573-821(+)